jgi:predicted nucleic acid-binding protein
VNGKNALFDSNILIYLSKEEIPFAFINQFDAIFVSVITYMEILGYPFEHSNEENFTKELLAVFQTLYLDQHIADITIEIRKKKRIKLPDAIIAATAISANLHLVTRNTSDFSDIDVLLLNPFE